MATYEKKDMSGNEPAQGTHPKECEVSGVRYELNLDGSSYFVVGPVEPSISSLVLPSAVFGLPVVVIKMEAFRGCTRLQKITIPDSVKKIGKKAFKACKRLQEITIGRGVISIGSEAFADCTGIVKVNITSLKSWCEIEFGEKGGNPLDAGNKAKLYVNNEEIAGALEIPAGTTKVGIRAFFKQSGITSITIPDSVTSIGSAAFYECTGITQVNYEGDLKAWCEIDFENSVSNPLSWASKNNVKLYVKDEEVAGAVKIPAGTTRIGKCAFYGLKNITSITIPDSVTSIDEAAFHGLTGITSVTIPDSVTSIGDHAFSDCPGITQVNYEGDLRAWCEIEFESYASNLLNGRTTKLYVNNEEVTGAVEIPAGTTKIGEGAFYGLKGITSITIPDSVTSIGTTAFADCTDIARVNYMGNLKSWCEIGTLLRVSGSAKLYVNNEEVVGAVEIPAGIKKIGPCAFSNRTGITLITIPDSVTSIGNSAFYGCTDIALVNYGGDLKAWCEIEFGNNYSNPLCDTRRRVKLHVNNERVAGAVEIPAGTIKIGDYAFCGFLGMTSVTIPDSVTSIGECAFEGCTGLQEITIPSSVTSIGEDAFQKCTSITRVNYGGDLKGWCEIEFKNDSSNPLCEVGSDAADDGRLSNAKLYVNGRSVVGAVKIPAGTTKIGDYAFHYVTGITSITIPDSVLSIGHVAFGNCYRLQEVTISDGVTSIGNNVFCDCISLREVTIPDSVTSIGSGAFRECTGLQEVTIGAGVTSIGGAAFRGCSGLQEVMIPDGATSIGSAAFDGCSGLQEVTIPGGVTSIESYTFRDCTGLQEITIPGSVTSIGYRAFYGCASITWVNYGGDLKAWCEIEFENAESNPLYGTNHAKLYVNDKRVAGTVEIPVGTNKVGMCAFCGLRNVTSVTIPDSVTSIGMSTFKDCSSLTRIDYQGTTDQWQALQKGSDWNGGTGEYTVYCTNGTIPKSES